MRAKRPRPPRELAFTWSEELRLIAEVEPVDSFADVIRLQVHTGRDRLVLRFDSREHVMFLLEAVLDLLQGLDKAANYVPYTKTCTLGRLG
jgi:hypothetical protein